MFQWTGKTSAAACRREYYFLTLISRHSAAAGFFAKYYNARAVLQPGNFYGLVIFAILCAAVSVYYYSALSRQCILRTDCADCRN